MHWTQVLADWWWLIPLLVGGLGLAGRLMRPKPPAQTNQQQYQQTVDQIQKAADEQIQRVRDQLKAESDAALAKHASDLITQQKNQAGQGQ